MRIEKSVFPCQSQKDCPESYFCYRKENCSPCIDCAVYRRENISDRICHEKPADCGKCLPGFRADSYTQYREGDFCKEIEEDSTASPVHPPILYLIIGVLISAVLLGTLIACILLKKKVSIKCLKNSAKQLKGKTTNQHWPTAPPAEQLIYQKIQEQSDLPNFKDKPDSPLISNNAFFPPSANPDKPDSPLISNDAFFPPSAYPEIGGACQNEPGISNTRKSENHQKAVPMCGDELSEALERAREQIRNNQPARNQVTDTGGAPAIEGHEYEPREHDDTGVPHPHGAQESSYNNSNQGGPTTNHINLYNNTIVQVNLENQQVNVANIENSYTHGQENFQQNFMRQPAID